MIDYTITDPVPGDFEHRGQDCEIHGPNVVFFRLRASAGPHYCVQCSLEAMSRKYDQELMEGAE